MPESNTEGPTDGNGNNPSSSAETPASKPVLKLNPTGRSARTTNPPVEGTPESTPEPTTEPVAEAVAADQASPSAETPPSPPEASTPTQEATATPEAAPAEPVAEEISPPAPEPIPEPIPEPTPVAAEPTPSEEETVTSPPEEVAPATEPVAPEPTPVSEPVAEEVPEEPQAEVTVSAKAPAEEPTPEVPPTEPVPVAEEPRETTEESPSPEPVAEEPPVEAVAASETEAPVEEPAEIPTPAPAPVALSLQANEEDNAQEEELEPHEGFADDEPSKKGVLVQALLVASVLFLLAGGAVYFIGQALFSGGETEPTANVTPTPNQPEALAQKPNDPPKKAGPIARAREAIAGHDRLTDAANEVLDSSLASESKPSVITAESSHSTVTQSPPRVTATPVFEKNQPTGVTRDKPTGTITRDSDPEPATAEPATAPVETTVDRAYMREVMLFIRSLDVSGSFGSARKSRLLVDGEVFHSGDIVSFDLNIRFLGVVPESKTAVFQDRYGQRYRKKL